MPSFEIPDIPPKAQLKQETENNQTVSTGAVTFTVTNKTGQGLSGRVTVEPQGEAKAEWFSVDGESERQFAAGGTHTFTVRIKTPPAATAGTYSLKVRAVAVNDPDNDFAESPVVVFDIAAPPVAAPKKKLPWWIFAAIGGGVAVVAGVVVAVILFTGGGGTKVPNVVDLPFTEAEQQLTAAKFTVVQENDPDSDKAPGTVTAQDPVADTEVNEGDKVTLRVAQGVEVKDVRGETLTVAEGVLRVNGGLKAERIAGPAGGKAPETVIGQDPLPPARAALGGTVKLTVDPGVAVPTSIAIPTTQQNAVNALQAAGLNVNIVGRCEQTGVRDQVIDLSPKQGIFVAKGSTVTVTIRALPRSPLLPCRRFDVLIAPTDRFIFQPSDQ
ncbi:PASTA domain-containing protein [Inquilinus sp. OTU3971]|uniref:PASTA domain-containing protein n=1 Tax=Inquilinus sp. OTU3971 TaxID=3043855 RepID=UPI00313C6069